MSEPATIEDVLRALENFEKELELMETSLTTNLDYLANENSLINSLVESCIELDKNRYFK
jgi:hypothetical protein